MILYLAVTPDKYELPLGVYDTAEDLLRHSINVKIEIEE